MTMRRGLLVLDLDNTVLYRQGFFHGLRLYVGSEDATGQRTGAEEAASAAAAAAAAAVAAAAAAAAAARLLLRLRFHYVPTLCPDLTCCVAAC
jgi:hypothetical protein